MRATASTPFRRERPLSAVNVEPRMCIRSGMPDEPGPPMASVRSLDRGRPSLGMRFLSAHAFRDTGLEAGGDGRFPRRVDGRIPRRIAGRAGPIGCAP